MTDSDSGPTARPPQNNDQAPSTEATATGSAEVTADPRLTIAGRYVVDLQAEPDISGISVIYPGRDLRSRDPVLVKTLRHEYRGDPTMRARFRREARLLQFLSHPHVIRALNFSEERGAPWLVLEKAPGQSLREVIGRDAPMSPERIVPLLTGIAAALDHLHSRGLVHLDLRPENVLVTSDGEVKLVDFGLAQTAGIVQEHADGSAQQTAYLAPEQISGRPVTVAADVYALGCVVFEMLTGTPPFPTPANATDRNAALRSRLESAPPVPSRSATKATLPGWIDDVVTGALEMNPQQRYSSTGSFASLFRAGVEGEVDVETGRPHAPAASRSIRRAFPLNEPGIATKGFPDLAARRGTTPAEPSTVPPVVDASFGPVAEERHVAFRRPVGLLQGRDIAAISHRLWQAVAVVAVLNLLLLIALVATRGEIPGVWQQAEPVGPGASVHIAGSGLVARAEPSLTSEIVANLPDGGEVQIEGPLVTGEDGNWWPVSLATEAGPVSGYVPEAWIQQQ